MADYVIITDSSCDLPAELAEAMNLTVLPLTVTISGSEYPNDLAGRYLSPKEFYRRMREGETSTTSAVNTHAFITAMREILSSGKDVLYIGFSSGLSGTYSAGETAAKEMAAEFPDRVVLAVDTLAASMGQGLLVYLAVKRKEMGETIQQVYQYVLDTRLHLCHWFTVDDLQHLKRGGRVSGAVATIGTILKIKPVMHVDDEGHLIKVSQARGRKASLIALVEQMAATAINPGEQTVFISHGDCLEDAEFVAKLIRERWSTEDFKINFVGPVIGAHAGAGVVALFFLGEKR